jgi:hypothetical protein
LEQMAWFAPALTVARGMMVTEVTAVTTGHGPLLVELIVNVMNPFARSVAVTK